LGRVHPREGKEEKESSSSSSRRRWRKRRMSFSRPTGAFNDIHAKPVDNVGPTKKDELPTN